MYLPTYLGRAALPRPGPRGLEEDEVDRQLSVSEPSEMMMPMSRSLAPFFRLQYPDLPGSSSSLALFGYTEQAPALRRSRRVIRKQVESWSFICAWRETYLPSEVSDHVTWGRVDGLPIIRA